MVDDPWGSYQSEPFFDKKTKIYQLALTPGLRSPWKPADETSPPEKPDRSDDVKIDVAGIQQRLIEAPIPPGNYNSLAVNDKSLFWLATPAGAKKSSLKGADIADKDVEIKNLTDDVQSFEMSNDGKKLLIEKEDSLYVIDATVAEAVDLAKKEVPLSNWTLTVNPREEWKQMFAEAWPLERDYFYDRNLHGVDWKEVRKKYEPLAARVAGRSELGDLLGQMVSELSALHIFVHGGDVHKSEDEFPPSFLGTVAPRRKGRRLSRRTHPPDRPRQPGADGAVGEAERQRQARRRDHGDQRRIDVKRGEHREIAAAPAGQQVLLSVKPGAGGDVRKTVAVPIDAPEAADFRYHSGNIRDARPWTS